MDKSYRIHTNIASDTVLNVNMKQDFDFLDVLTLKLGQTDAYKLHSSNYGVIIGRVLANDAFGIPNAKISVFIERDTKDSTEIENIYPYTEVTSKDKNSIRYNLLPDYSNDDCYRIVGTFPNKRLLLDDDTYLEVYDKYWKYSTVTNNAGDYMLFAVPTGSQQIHVDIDLSDIGILSQKPRDLIYKGYNINEFDNANQFKESTNLETLKQIISQNKSVFVYPFWGDSDNGIAAITRCDIQVDYKFEPTCIFMGSIVSDNEENAIGHKCAAEEDNGMNYQLVAGEGTIEMIRKTTDGLVEEYQIQGNRLIDSNGVWCYQIPMNLDYIGTDEYGNIVPTDNPNKGIPTRTQVRFRISKIESTDEAISRHTAKYLVPMNPPFEEDKVIPQSALSGKEYEKMYNFGSNTPQNCFRDLYWNNVYSVKNYIPKTQVAHRAYSPNYSALKGSNLVDNQNPIPFNKLRIDVPFMFMVVCIIFTIILYVVAFINTIICLINTIIYGINSITGFRLPLIGRVFSFIPEIPYIGCMTLGAGLSDGNIAYYPGCKCSTGLNEADCPEDMESNCKKNDSSTDLKEKIIENLAEEHQVVKLDLYQDWINGCLYMPLWYWRKSKKKTFLFGLFSRSAKNEFCDCDKKYSRLKTYVTCDIEYTGNSLEVNSSSVDEGEDKWHKKKRDSVRYKNGLIKGVTNKDNLKAYYYVAMQPTSDNDDELITERGKGFYAFRLYATDIILLGNINENNIYGIPQFFKALPSTTANIPAIATIEESINDDEDVKGSDIGEGEDSGTTITTGMHWGIYGKNATPTYGTGLFMDLGCTFADTKAKSCINAERLSEYGVNLDMTHSVSYTEGSTSSIKTGLMSTDGFITKLELEDFENRSMFATLNHIGFVPQAYQDSINGYTTQVQDDNTNYLVPKFQFIYPVDFDGRMQPSMTRYKKNFQQAMYDEIDEGYLTFRLGAEKNQKSEKRIRHFYHANGNRFHMPLYDNSFYFYFGINKGNTAIDKFNSMFMADCVKNSKEPFSFDIDKRSKSYCYANYTSETPYSYIKISSDDITKPYSYSIYDSIGGLVIRESGMSADTFNIIDESNGRVKYQLENELTYPTNNYGQSGLTNQMYNVILTDANGKSISQRVILDMPTITMDYESFSLGTKYYNKELSSIDYICGEENDFYGRIKIKGFTVDGFDVEIESMTIEAFNPNTGYLLSFGVKNTEKNFISTIKLYVDVLDKERDGEVEECLCKVEGSMPRITVHSENYTTENGRNKTRKYVQFDIYQPRRYSFKAYQICNGVNLEESMYYDIIIVPNGSNFNTFLNTMPTLFMLGSNNEGNTMPIATTSKFYSLDAITNPLDSHISGWYGLHQENTYQFDRASLQTLARNQEVWSDFVNIPDSIVNPITKLSILRYKLRAMFELSRGAYEDGEFTFSSVGGVQPTLYRTVAPVYSNESMMDTTYELDDNSTVTITKDYPNIVGSNYSGNTNVNNPVFNSFYKGNRNFHQYIGNYFAAFTNNGGYKNKKELDREMGVMRSPSNASVSPYTLNSIPKEIGRIIRNTIGNFSFVHTKGKQTLLGDRNRNVTPYLRALNVDRKLDYDLTFIAPAIDRSFYLYGRPSESEEEKTEPWMGARIFGTIYGGIEMSYDNYYNIISADTTWNEDGEVMRVTPNNKLEYSYTVSSDDTNAYTIYHRANEDSVWEEDESDGMIIKRFYSLALGTVDLRNYVWSNFNKKRLMKELRNQNWREISATTTPYIFSYPSGQTSYYNGDFSRESIIEGNNYPTKRYIDICNIRSFGMYTFELSSCSYNSNVMLNEDETLSCEVNEGDSVDFEINFESPIEFVSETSDSDANNLSSQYESGNIRYNKNGTVDGYTRFTSTTANLRFNLTKKTSSNFDVYTPAPSVIIVKPFKNGVDGITYFKTASPNGEINAAKSVWGAIRDVLLWQFSGFFASLFGINYIHFNIDCQLADGIKMMPLLEVEGKRIVELGGGAFFYDNNTKTFITSNDSKFDKNIFYRSIDIRNVEIFTIIATRYYISSDSQLHISKLRTVEMSELFDVRDCLLKCVSGDQGEPLSYVEGVVVYDEPAEEGGETTSSMTYAQTVSFEMKINNDNCQSFLNYDTMTFTCLVRRRGNIFAVGCEEPKLVEETAQYTRIRITSTWPDDMGYLGDGNGTACSLQVRTYSNFIYNFYNFGIRGEQSSLPTTEGEKKITNNVRIE